MKKGNTLDNLLLYLALIVFACSFLLVRQTFDIRIFDTFYVIKLRFLYCWLAFALLVSRLFYYYEPLPLFSKKLKKINIVATLLVAASIPLFHIYSGQLSAGNLRIDLYDVPLFYRHNLVLTFLLFALVLAQLPVAINAGWGIYLKNYKKARI